MTEEDAKQRVVIAYDEAARRCPPATDAETDDAGKEMVWGIVMTVFTGSSA
jgi:hypothetical protein